MEGGWGLACLRREREPPCSVLLVAPPTRTRHAGGTKVRADNSSRYLTLARVKRLRRVGYIYATFRKLLVRKRNGANVCSMATMYDYFIVSETKCNLSHGTKLLFATLTKNTVFLCVGLISLEMVAP